MHGLHYRISQFLDEKVYLSQNEAHLKHPAQLQSADNAASVSNSNNNRGGDYDQTQNPAHTSQVTAVSTEPQYEILEHSTADAAQYCEMHEASMVGGPTTSQDYEVPATNWREEVPYSHLIHKWV